MSLYAVYNIIWMLIATLSRYPYKVKLFNSAIYSAGVAASSAAGASSVAGACSALPPA
ncbi:secreted protein [marine sediment metagenome]|uniref:Secreted protein n=1 Tax=marine sediment metagenome TaxID=412755 RepID=A0A1B6NTZ5_9ZZZZ